MAAAPCTVERIRRWLAELPEFPAGVEGRSLVPEHDDGIDGTGPAGRQERGKARNGQHHHRDDAKDSRIRWAGINDETPSHTPDCERPD